MAIRLPPTPMSMPAPPNTAATGFQISTDQTDITSDIYNIVIISCYSYFVRCQILQSYVIDDIVTTNHISNDSAEK